MITHFKFFGEFIDKGESHVLWEKKEEYEWLWKLFTNFLEELDKHVKRETAQSYTTQGEKGIEWHGFCVIMHDKRPNSFSIFDIPGYNIETGRSTSIAHLNKFDEYHMSTMLEEGFFRIGIMPDDKFIPNWFNMKFELKNHVFVPTTFDRSDSLNKTQWDRQRKNKEIVGEDVYLAITALIKGEVPTKKTARKVADKFQHVLETAPILDLTRQRGIIIGKKFGI